MVCFARRDFDAARNLPAPGLLSTSNGKIFAWIWFLPMRQAGGAVVRGSVRHMRPAGRVMPNKVKEVLRKLKRAGFEERRQSGSHQVKMGYGAWFGLMPGASKDLPSSSSPALESRLQADREAWQLAQTG
jgi:hypothetical protein